PHDVAIADLNRDGKLDLAVANSGSSNSVTILLGNGSGGFSEASGSPIGVGSQPVSIAVGDFNRDGKLDLAVACAAGALDILLGNGAGGFSGTTLGEGSDQSVAAGDLNGDGKLDLVVAHPGTNGVKVGLGDGSGGFSFGETLSTGTDPEYVAI